MPGLIRYFAIFDLDHTLLPFDTQALFCNFVLKRHRWRVLLHAIFIPVALARGCRIASDASARRALHAYLWGMPATVLRALAHEFAHTSVVRWSYPELTREIRRHLEEGAVLVLNSASPDFYVGEIANALGITHCVATRFEVGDRVPLMPRLPDGANLREHKVSAMFEQIPSTAAFTAEGRALSWCYSDSLADLPLLTLVGHPVAVHPTPRLAALVAERAWPVMTPVRPYRTRLGDAYRTCLQLVGLHAQ